MALFEILDLADEFRIQIAGCFTGDQVTDIRAAWEKALAQPALRRVTVDISRMEGYDPPARKLLREMHRHGTSFAAGTPASLVFLDEISTRVRRGPALVQAPAAEPPKAKSASSGRAKPFPAGRALAANE